MNPELQKELTQFPDYFFEKTEATEVAPRPTPFTFSLLEKIYAQNGPVAQAYKKFKITYVDTAFLVNLLGQLYVDREKELASLFPAMSYGKTDITPKIVRLKGALTTTKNMAAFARNFSTEEAITELSKALNGPEVNMSFADALEHFLNEYQIIFEINFLAAASFKKLETVLPKNNLSYVDILSVPEAYFGKTSTSFKKPESVLGNSLEISDEKPFTASTPALQAPKNVESWWSATPEISQKVLLPLIQNALRLQAAREAGRWLMVKNMNTLRRALASKEDYFATIDEILGGATKQEILSERKRRYAEDLARPEFPALLRSGQPLAEKNTSIKVLSPGDFSGELVDKDEKLPKQHDIVLLIDALSPNFVEKLPYIQGIISKSGGVLSHLAIVAREKGIPVIICDPKSYGLEKGKNVRVVTASGATTITLQ